MLSGFPECMWLYLFVLIITPLLAYAAAYAATHATERRPRPAAALRACTPPPTWYAHLPTSQLTR
eukprot:1368505-Pleurochrysis_carterae.AAC.1